MEQINRSEILSERIKDLQEEYERFRLREKPGALIPEDLRLATLDLLDSGGCSKTIRRCCNLRLDQIARWKNSKELRRRPNPPRILEVMKTPEIFEGATRVTIEGTRVIIDLPVRG